MSFFELENLRHASGGRWLRKPDRETIVEGVAIDTRQPLAGRAFVALRGERHDAHDFLHDAADAGAALLVVEGTRDEKPLPPGPPVLAVDSTRRALLRLAAAYRQRLQGVKVIGITGSSGKTTTRRLIHDVLSTRLRGTESPRSFNNDVGVPLTVLSASPSDKFLLVEIGMNAPGEIAELTAAVQPDIGVVTSVGLAHLGGVGSAEAIAREKASLLRHLRPGGLAVASIDNPILLEHLRGLEPLVTFGTSADADLRLTARASLPGGGQTCEANGRFRFTLPLPGAHNAVNALAAIAVGRRLGLPDESIVAGLASARGADMRLAMRTVAVAGGTVHLVNDAYNANPDSMAAGLDAFVEMTASHDGRRLVMLGDMLELGDAAPALHRAVGEAVARADMRAPVALAVFVGPLMAAAADVARRRLGEARVTWMARLDDAGARRAAALVQPGDALFLKGSRGMAMERVAAALQSEPRSPSAPGTVDAPSWGCAGAGGTGR